MSLATDLLEQARALVALDARKPKQASLRRAVSVAYYSLFHLLCTDASGRLARGGANELKAAVFRAFDHRAMKKAASRFMNERPAQELQAIITTVPPELRDVAIAFHSLHQARAEADYNIGRAFSRGEVIDLVDQAERAFIAWAEVKNASEAQVFLIDCASLIRARN